MIGHTFDLLDINYVYLPKMKDEFISEIAPDNPRCAIPMRTTSL